MRGDELGRFDSHFGGRSDAPFMAGTATSLLDQIPIGGRRWAPVGATKQATKQI